MPNLSTYVTEVFPMNLITFPYCPVFGNALAINLPKFQLIGLVSLKVTTKFNAFLKTLIFEDSSFCLSLLEIIEAQYTFRFVWAQLR